MGRFMGDVAPELPILPGGSGVPCKVLSPDAYALLMSAAPSLPDDCARQLANVAGATRVGANETMMRMALAALVGAAVGGVLGFTLAGKL